MLIERIYDEDLAQAAYLIGCQATGEAIIVDGRRDLKPLLDLAAAHGMKVVAAAETHIHADYLSGTREIAAATGATAYVSGEGGTDWQYDFDAKRLHDGDTIKIGNITIEAVHTPGHTPEHLSYLVTDGAFADEPGYFLTGDFVFSGDLGRPDLLDEAAGGVDTRFVGAKQQFQSLKEKFLTLPDHVMVYPGHGAGSACGKALGALPSTTVGYERRFAWWAKYLDANDEQGFVDELLAGQPDAPAYFGRMKRQNRQGPVVMGQRPALTELDPTVVQQGIDAGELVFFDTRPADQINACTVRGSVAVPSLGKIATWGGWVFDPETDKRGLVVYAADTDAAQLIADHLVRVGIDDVRGYLSSIDGLDTFTPEIVPVTKVDGFDRAELLDVRAKNEYAAGHLPGAVQLHAGRLLWNQDQLPQDGKVLLYCQSGMRATVAANTLRARGYNVAQVDGSYNAWVAAGLSIEQ
ncbi:MBL fold metallo-hydrolase [uncultured Gulosibacter sp.]|uniref:MBL fold metallo-hydrolase n=1 Tax=uncultured Gulosibacter sp. TaxID=1339167 RepID=UPI0028898680|nr:MBL fold metallo-hydrolase [uncultured Gulosibacter sp.]